MIITLEGDVEAEVGDGGEEVCGSCLSAGCHLRSNFINQVISAPKITTHKKYQLLSK